MKNKLIHLNNHLFEQLERLNDADLKSEELQEEMSRAKAITCGQSNHQQCASRFRGDEGSE